MEAQVQRQFIPSSDGCCLTLQLLLAVGADPEPLNATLQSFSELESLGIPGPEETVHDKSMDSVTFKDGRYEVSLLWRKSHTPLPDNYQLSLNRLHGLLRQLKQNPEILQEYDGVKDQLQKGFVKPAPEECEFPDRLYYLPHHAVVCREKATTKVCVAYDG